MARKRYPKYLSKKRKPYRGSRRFDYTCRNHGGCSWCKGNRLHKRRLAERIAKEKLKEAEGAQTNGS